MKNLIAITFFLFSIFIHAQRNNNSNISTPYIEVTGSASKSVKPDRISISIIVSESTTRENKVTIAEQENIINSQLVKQKIDPKSLKMTGISTQILMDEGKEIGLKYTKSFELVLTSAQEVSTLFQNLYEKGILQTSVKHLWHSKYTEYYEELRKEALLDAKNRAKKDLKVLGYELGDAIEIKETSSHFDFQYHRGNVYTRNSLVSTTEFEDVDINCSFKIKFYFFKPL